MPFGVLKPSAPACRLVGSENQVAWAEEIRVRVNAEFDRVAKAFATVAASQTGQNHLDSVAVIAILEEKRAEVMARDTAGYFIHEWQELSDQVRQLIAKDLRYQAIKAARVNAGSSGSSSSSF